MCAPCPACGRTEVVRWRSARASDPRPGRDRYPLLRCRSCGSAWVPEEDRPAEPATLYDGGTYARPAHVVDRALEPLRRLADLERLASLRGLPPGARILDVGSGDGRFVAELRRRGFRAAGTDAYPRGDAVAPAAAEALASAPASYDAVIAWHVLEHVDDPAEAVRRAHVALVPGGRLVLATPNLASVQAYVGGDRWFHQDVPRHTVLFTARGVDVLVRRAGFDSIRIRHLGGQQNLFGMWQTLVNRVTTESDVAFRAVKRAGPFRPTDLVRTAVGGIAAVPLALALEPAAAFVRRGGAVVATATKKAA